LQRSGASRAICVPKLELGNEGVPKLELGNEGVPKLELGNEGVPKLELGNEGMELGNEGDFLPLSPPGRMEA